MRAPRGANFSIVGREHLNLFEVGKRDRFLPRDCLDRLIRCVEEQGLVHHDDTLVECEAGCVFRRGSPAEPFGSAASFSLWRGATVTETCCLRLRGSGYTPPAGCRLLPMLCRFRSLDERAEEAGFEPARGAVSAA